jgi:hypothetical protein
MRIFVIALEGITPDQMLKDERLANLRQLMSAGFYGYLALSAGASSFEESIVCDRVARSGARVVQADRRNESLQQQTAHACSLLADGAWTYLRVVLGPSPGGGSCDEEGKAEALALDGAIGQVLELLDDQTVVLLLIEVPGDAPKPRERESACGAFVLAAPGYPGKGELDGVAWGDLAPTVLDMAGYGLPASPAGRSLLADLDASGDTGDLSMEEEALLRARLEGLGYIG